jgi:hypothetical protein
MRSEKPPASPARSVLEMEPETPDSGTPRKSRPGPGRVRSGTRGSAAVVQNGHSSMQSPDVAGLEQLRQTMQATLGTWMFSMTPVW